MHHVLTHKDAETQCSYLPEGNPLSGITDTKLGLPTPVSCSGSEGRLTAVKQDCPTGSVSSFPSAPS